MSYLHPAKPKVKDVSLILIIFLIVLLSYLAGASQLFQNSSINFSSDAEIIRYLAKSIELPSETPTIAEIVDSQALKNQDPIRYQNVKNGDKVIIYSNRGIIFRPSTGRIIDFFSITK
jgi:hypothetical protein